MTIARCRQVSVETTPYYHVIGRCVRRAFLCGLDASSGKDYEHRRQWVIERLELLCSVFAVDLCSYTIMSNHYHLVVRLAPGRVELWADEEVLERWEKLYGIATPIAIGMAETADPAQRLMAKKLIDLRRDRLSNLSWFMKCLNEHIARRANLEDKCTGSFWEGRFISQALLDEKALLSCMAYVDLNPIRAGMAKSLQTSDFTAVQARINGALGKKPPLPLLAFEDQLDNTTEPLPYYLSHYLELVDWTGRAVRDDKRGSIPKELEPILDSLGFDEESWLTGFKLFGQPLFQAVGPADQMRQAAQTNQRSWYRGTSACQIVFGPP
jgi:REP element-mobilizing transposase RayT